MEPVRHADDHKKLAELIKGVRVAMMHTLKQPRVINGMNALHIRPMYTQKVDPENFSGELFFFSDADSAKVNELAENAEIMLTYAAPDKDQFVVVKGMAVCEHNPGQSGGVVEHPCQRLVA